MLQITFDVSQPGRKEIFARDIPFDSVFTASGHSYYRTKQGYIFSLTTGASYGCGGDTKFTNYENREATLTIGKAV